MKLVSSPTRPDRIYFRTRLDPNVNGIDVCTACSPASVRKNPGVLPTDLAAAPLFSFSLFTYLLAYYFIFLADGYMLFLSLALSRVRTVMCFAPHVFCDLVSPSCWVLIWSQMCLVISPLIVCVFKVSPFSLRLSVFECLPFLYSLDVLPCC